MFLGLTLVDFIIILAIYFVIHYITFSRYNMKKSYHYINLLHRAFKGLGYSVGDVVKRRGLHRFEISSGNFVKGIVFTLLLPREMPINWLLSKFLHRSDYVVLEANLVKAPVVQMEILRDSPRWSKLLSSPPSGWVVSRVDSVPFYLSVYRGEGLEYWVKKVREFMSKNGSRMTIFDRISFRYRPPHIIVNFTLDRVEGYDKILYSLRLLTKIIDIVTAYKLKKGKKKV